MKTGLVIGAALTALVAGLLFVLTHAGPRGSFEARPEPRAAVGTPHRPGMKTYRLLVIDSQSRGHYQQIGQARREYLGTHWYVEGKNLHVDSFSIDNDVALAEAILREHLSDGYDVICLNGTVPTIAAKNVAYGDSRYNFVFASVTDPVDVGVIDAFYTAPKANFTGVSCPVPVDERLRFVRRLMPEAKTIGLIYADMPQSHSYRRWIEKLVANEPEFSDLVFVFRQVDLVTGEGGTWVMAEEAKEFVKEIDPLVDVFLSPSDQMGAQEYFARAVYETATKPLIGLLLVDVMENRGAVAAMYASPRSMGLQSAKMIVELFEGADIREIFPEEPAVNGIAIDLRKAERFGITVSDELIEQAGDNIIRTK
jgi:putative ABC transport system substrate-binding protein